MLLKAYYLDKLSQLTNVRLLFDQNIAAIENDGTDYICRLSSGQEYAAPYVLNASYVYSLVINAPSHIPSLK